MNRSHLTGTISAQIPFFGLGFDMDSVLDAAAATRLEPALPTSRRSFSPDVPASAGFMLQLKLGSIIRAP